MRPKTLLISLVIFAACMSAIGTRVLAQTSRTSGVYLTAADYQNGRLGFEGD